jgi:uncharacterized protein YegL
MLQRLQNALPIVAAALGRKFGVTVGVGGREARTDGATIQIPDLPEDPLSRTLAWGYLAHEAAHVRYTDFAVYTEAAREGPLQANLQNVIEDVRIEQALAGPYPGTRTSIAAVFAQILAEGRLAAPQPGDHPAQVLAGYVLLTLRHEVLGQRMLAGEAHRAAVSLQAVFPAAFIARLRSLLAEVPELKNTAETVDLARRIRRLIEDEAHPTPQTGGTGETGANAAPSTREADEAAAPGVPVANGAESETDPNDVGNPESQGSPAPGKEGRNGEEETPAIGSDPHDKADGSESSAPDGDPKGSGANALTDGERKALQAVLSAGAGDGGGDLFAEIGQRLAAQAAGSSRTQLPIAEDYAGSPLAGRRLIAKVEAESARLRARLQGLVQASRLERSRAVRCGRRLHPRRLHRVAVGEARVFQHKAPRWAPNTAVHLLIDLSGSMSDEVVRKDGTLTWRSTLAQESALALALALTGIPGVAVAATAFPGRAGSPERVTRMLRPGQSVRDAAGAFLQHPRGGTPLAQALWFAAAELLARREPRRLLMVLTDGAPDDAREAARLLTLARAAAIETVGIGIGVDVRHLFVTALTVHAFADLKDALFGVAEQLLVGAAA